MRLAPAEGLNRTTSLTNRFICSTRALPREIALMVSVSPQVTGVRHPLKTQELFLRLADDGLVI
jgi:hypothetical protein